MNTTDAKEVAIHLEDKQLVRITGYKREWFTAGSLEGFHNASTTAALKWNWPTRTIQEELERAKKEGHAIAWLNLNGTCISGDPGYYEQQRKIEATAVIVPLHGLVELEGRIYQVEPDHNDNVKLVPQ